MRKTDNPENKKMQMPLCEQRASTFYANHWSEKKLDIEERTKIYWRSPQCRSKQHKLQYVGKEHYARSSLEVNRSKR